MRIRKEIHTWYRDEKWRYEEEEGVQTNEDGTNLKHKNKNKNTTMEDMRYKKYEREILTEIVEY